MEGKDITSTIYQSVHVCISDIHTLHLYTGIAHMGWFNHCIFMGIFLDGTVEMIDIMATTMNKRLATATCIILKWEPVLMPKKKVFRRSRLGFQRTACDLSTKSNEISKLRDITWSFISRSNMPKYVKHCYGIVYQISRQYETSYIQPHVTFVWFLIYIAEHCLLPGHVNVYRTLSGSKMSLQSNENRIKDHWKHWTRHLDLINHLLRKLGLTTQVLRNTRIKPCFNLSFIVYG